MLVTLKTDWFAPNAQHFSKGVVDVPERFCERKPDGKFKYLPSSAEIVSERPAEAAEPEQSLKDHDPERAAVDAEKVALDEAEKERLANAERIRAKLAQERNPKK